MQMILWELLCEHIYPQRTQISLLRMHLAFTNKIYSRVYLPKILKYFFFDCSNNFQIVRKLL